MTSSWHMPFWMAWDSVCLGGRCPHVLQVGLTRWERQEVRALEVTLALCMGHLSLTRPHFCLEGGRKDRQVVALFKKLRRRREKQCLSKDGAMARPCDCHLHTTRRLGQATFPQVTEAAAPCHSGQA